MPDEDQALDARQAAAARAAAVSAALQTSWSASAHSRAALATKQWTRAAPVVELANLKVACERAAVMLTWWPRRTGMVS